MRKGLFRLSVGLTMGAVWFAASGEGWALSCGQLQLKDASGVIGPFQKYSAAAKCVDEHATTKKGKLTWTGYESTTTNPNNIYLEIMGKASWNRKTGEAKESLFISGDAKGKRITTATCTQDPFLKDPPGDKASCKDFVPQYQGETGPAYEFFVSPAFFLAKTIRLAEAQALSESAKDGPKPNNPPPPPPMPNKTMTSPGGAQVWEGETLLRNRKYLVGGGKLARQPMEAFGPDWSGDAHLLWTEGAVGAVLDLVIDVAKRGAYRVSLGLTQGPDFGIIDAEVNGEKSSMKFDGYSPTVKRVDPVELGTFNLNAGPRKIALMIIGKNSQSTNFLVGIDRVTITPVK
jgi:hypothetical protein